MAAALRNSLMIADRRAQARRSGGYNARQAGDCKRRKERNVQVDGQATAYGRQPGYRRSTREKMVTLQDTGCRCQLGAYRKQEQDGDQRHM